MISYLLVSVAFLTAYVLSTCFAARWRSAQLQRETPALRAGERDAVHALLVQAYCQRVVEEPAFLKRFLDEYLGEAAAAKRQAWDRASQDPDSVGEMVVDALHKRTDEQLLMGLIQNFRHVPPKACPFDPYVRLGQLQEARQLMTQAQGWVAGVGLLVLLVMILFPPWIRQQDDVTWMLWSQQSREIQSEAFIGYRFVFWPRPEDDIERISTGNLGQSRQRRDRTRIAVGVLSLQMVGVLLVVPGVIYGLRRSKQLAPSP